MYVVGSFKNTADFDVYIGTATERVMEVQIYSLLSINKYGLLVWANSNWWFGSDEAKRVVLDGAMNIYVCGSFAIPLI